MFSIIRLSRSSSGHLVPRRRHGLLTVFGSPLWPVIRNPESRRTCPLSWSLIAGQRRSFLYKSGSRLFFHTVASIVPSAVQGLTVVFGMGTGISPARIATRQIIFFVFLQLTNIWHLSRNTALTTFLRKEVIQPHLPIQLPCYDFTPVIGPAFDGSLFR